MGWRSCKAYSEEKVARIILLLNSSKIFMMWSTDFMHSTKYSGSCSKLGMKSDEALCSVWRGNCEAAKS
jgi:hypothetical protein